MATVDTSSNTLISTGVNSFSDKTAHSLRKTQFFSKLSHKLIHSNQVTIFTLNNIPTLHLQSLRSILHSKFSATIMAGKTTMMECVVRNLTASYDPNLSKILPFLKGKVGCVFSYDCNLLEIRKQIEGMNIKVTAKPGMVAPSDVTVFKGPTNLPPEKTAFLMSAGIPTRIVCGKIEIMRDVVVVNKGAPVSETAAKVLEILKIVPFVYGMEVKALYEKGELAFDMDLLRQMEVMMRRGMEEVLGLSLGMVRSGKSVSVDVDENNEDVEEVNDQDGESDGEGFGIGLFGDEENVEGTDKQGKDDDKLSIGDLFGSDD